jgi:hypothetical protein
MTRVENVMMQIGQVNIKKCSSNIVVNPKPSKGETIQDQNTNFEIWHIH